ncbi:MAG: hypothetical protein LBH13_04650 [Cellulomonadaceae bacterium]|nr:hypothetical protein [Cellulomonadaceae bacterium]
MSRNAARTIRRTSIVCTAAALGLLAGSLIAPAGASPSKWIADENETNQSEGIACRPFTAEAAVEGKDKVESVWVKTADAIPAQAAEYKTVTSCYNYTGAWKGEGKPPVDDSNWHGGNQSCNNNKHGNYESTPAGIYSTSDSNGNGSWFKIGKEQVLVKAAVEAVPEQGYWTDEIPAVPAKDAVIKFRCHLKPQPTEEPMCEIPGLENFKADSDECTPPTTPDPMCEFEGLENLTADDPACVPPLGNDDQFCTAEDGGQYPLGSEECEAVVPVMCEIEGLEQFAADAPECTTPETPTGDDSVLKQGNVAEKKAVKEAKVAEAKVAESKVAEAKLAATDAKTVAEKTAVARKAPVAATAKALQTAGPELHHTGASPVLMVLSALLLGGGAFVVTSPKKAATR